MDDIRSFVLLKYKMITSNDNSWSLAEAYPIEIRRNWAWRCAEDVEHLAKGNLYAEKLIAAAKDFRRGKISYDYLKNAWWNTSNEAALAHYYIYHEKDTVDIHAVYFAVCAQNKSEEKDKIIWNKYIDWLIEELSEYESKRNV